MKTFHLENLPFDPAQEAGKDAMRQMEKNSPSVQDSELLEQVMKRHKLTREKAAEMLEAFGC
jgi:hypothetical protein